MHHGAAHTMGTAQQPKQGVLGEGKQQIVASTGCVGGRKTAKSGLTVPLGGGGRGVKSVFPKNHTFNAPGCHANTNNERICTANCHKKYAHGGELRLSTTREQNMPQRTLPPPRYHGRNFRKTLKLARRSVRIRLINASWRWPHHEHSLDRVQVEMLVQHPLACWQMGLGKCCWLSAASGEFNAT